MIPMFWRMMLPFNYESGICQIFGFPISAIIGHII